MEGQTSDCIQVHLVAETGDLRTFGGFIFKKEVTPTVNEKEAGITQPGAQGLVAEEPGFV